MSEAMQDEEQYLCVGVCMADPDSGYCLGCGRPPLPAPPRQGIVVEELVRTELPVEIEAGAAS